MKTIFFTVTNDLSFDQRMQRICGSLSANGYAVTLVGRRLPGSMPLEQKNWRQIRLRCRFNKGKLFYFEFNLRLILFLLFRKMDALCAIDLDTMIACQTVSYFRHKKRIYDAHELFTELKEVISRPRIQRIWQRLEKKGVPRFPLGYTVSKSIADEFHRRYGVNYETIRNMPVLLPLEKNITRNPFILYQGAVNEARCFEQLVPAMQYVDAKLLVCGDGNFMPQLKQLIARYKLENKIELMGMLTPDKLREISSKARVGIALAEKEGLNQYLALPNKFFDYIHAGLPQVTMNYPEYKRINEQFEVAVLLDEPDPEKIAAAINNLMSNTVLYNRLAANCLLAREEFNWQREENKLLEFYQKVFSS